MRLTRTDAKLLSRLFDAAGELLDPTENTDSESILTLWRGGLQFDARWDDDGNVVVDISEE